MTKNVVLSSHTLNNFAGLWRSQAAPTIPSGTLHSFTATNPETGTCSGFFEFGCPLPDGLVDDFTSFVVKENGTEIDCQVDAVARSDWRGVRFCVITCRTTDFAASESRSYTVEVKLADSTDIFNDTHSLTLADVRAFCDWKLQLDNVQTHDGTTQQNDTLATTLYCQFNEASKTAANVEIIRKGPVAVEYRVKSNYNTLANLTGTDHDHLQCWMYLTVYLNSNGTINNTSFAARNPLTWWGKANKMRQIYDATTFEGATQKQQFLAVDSAYHTQPMVCVDTGSVDARYCLPVFQNAGPTLHIAITDRQKWIDSGYIPKVDLTIDANASTLVYSDPYVPCGTMGHRSGLDAGGGYSTRGELTNPDTIAFISQDVTRDKHMRTRAMIGDSMNYHCHQDRNNERTCISLIMEPKAASEYTFDGMTPQHAYKGASTAAGYVDNWVEPLGGEGAFNTSSDSSHAANYSYYAYLKTGQRYYLDQSITLTTNLAHQMHGGDYGACPKTMYSDDAYRASLLSIPTTQWSAIGNFDPGMERSVGWAINIMAGTYGLMPDGDVQTPYIKAFVEHNFDYAKEAIDYLPSEQVAAGIYYIYKGSGVPGYIVSPWMINFQAISLAKASKIIPSNANVTAFRQLLENFVAGYWSGGGYLAAAYRAQIFEDNASAWHRDNNPIVAPNAGHYSITLTSSTNKVTPVIGEFALADDDEIIFANTDGSGNSVSVPAEVTAGVTYYLRNVAGGDADLYTAPAPGGTQVTITSNGAFTCCARLASFEQASASYPPYLPNDDSYHNIAKAACIALNSVDNTTVTDALAIKADGFTASPSNYLAWSAKR